MSCLFMCLCLNFANFYKIRIQLSCLCLFMCQVLSIAWPYHAKHVYTGLLCVPWFVYIGFDKIVPGWDYVPGSDNCQPYSSLCSLIRTIKYIIIQCTLLNSVDNSLYIVVYGVWYCSWLILLILLPLWCSSIALHLILYHA